MKKVIKVSKKVKDNKVILEKIVNKLLSLMGTQANTEVLDDKDNDAYLVNIDTKEEAGLIIGNRGKTINSIQMILGLIFKQKTNEWKRIIVNVGDWRQKEEGRLKQLAYQTAERAKTTKEPQYLFNLTPSQRRIIHITLSSDKSISTESQGEDKERCLVITPHI